MEKRSRWQKKQRKPSSLHSNPLKQITKELSKTIVCGFLVAVISNFLLQVFQNQFNVDELIITSHIYDHESKVKSYEIFREVVDELNDSAKV